MRALRPAVLASAVLFCFVLLPLVAAQNNAAEAGTIVIDAKAPARPFPHFWEGMFGSGRAVLTLRDSYRSEIKQVKQVIDFRYVRFHNILHDEVGVYD